MTLTTVSTTVLDCDLPSSRAVGNVKQKGAFSSYLLSPLYRAYSNIDITFLTTIYVTTLRGKYCRNSVFPKDVLCRLYLILYYSQGPPTTKFQNSARSLRPTQEANFRSVS